MLDCAGPEPCDSLSSVTAYSHQDSVAVACHSEGIYDRRKPYEGRYSGYMQAFRSCPTLALPHSSHNARSFAAFSMEHGSPMGVVLAIMGFRESG